MNIATGTTAKASVDARVLRLNAKAAEADSLNPQIATLRLARERDEDALIEIAAAGVNPSDVKAGMGMMPYAVFPRTPAIFRAASSTGRVNLSGRKSSALRAISASAATARMRAILSSRRRRWS